MVTLFVELFEFGSATRDICSLSSILLVDFILAAGWLLVEFSGNFFSYYIFHAVHMFEFLCCSYVQVFSFHVPVFSFQFSCSYVPIFFSCCSYVQVFFS